VVYPTKTSRWGYKIGDRFGPKTYPTSKEAKLALFDDFWALPRMTTSCGLRTDSNRRDPRQRQGHLKSNEYRLDRIGIVCDDFCGESM
jgi:hypothetical protein